MPGPVPSGPPGIQPDQGLQKPHITLTAKKGQFGQKSVGLSSPVTYLKNLFRAQEKEGGSSTPVDKPIGERSAAVVDKARTYTALPRAKGASDVSPEYQGNVKGAPDLNSVAKQRLLGEGSFGQVHLVTNPLEQGEVKDSPTVLQKQYVVKTQRAGKEEVEARQSAAEKEVAIQKAVPGSVQIQQERRINNGHQVMMEYGGVELESLIKSGKGKALPEALVKDLSRQLLSQLSKSHEQGILHRDIKPENILVNHKGQLTLADFGLSLKAGNDVEPDKAVFKGVAGTPDYMAPEVWTKKGYSFNADIWSAGLVLYQMATGEKTDFFSTVYDSDGEVRQGFDSAEVGRVRKRISRHKKLSPELKELLLGMIQSNPKKRLSAKEAI
ncbi:hypothetical protein EOPP23_20905 [Endozoicomonas sp. OPT23]|uniref:serine/threonine-protein kinase n=1 Tax=Endozoicomonas sp. OPT23 TaxID=2072845 RepID=UPI00129B184E|nr:serine/threonine-protein kinase [Endozoicomonas sp. OPT23]MRI35423.1 hypothetical protein [Endozoicomonas sp. OPT23]